MKKLRVGIIFGGESAEHEVSIMSARNVAEALDPQKYEVVLLGISRKGEWLPPAKSTQLLGPTNAVMAPTEAASLLPSTLLEREADRPVDVIFPVLHGPHGEDGTVQGLLALAHVPFVGAGVLGSAIGMDKEVMKRLLQQANLPIGRYEVVRKGRSIDFNKIASDLGWPVFVKPANMGSSVGVSKVSTRAELEQAIEQAFTYDAKVLVEQQIVGQEVECAVLGNDPPKASVVGEIRPTHDFYSYEAKYLDENGAELVIPADLPEPTAAQVRELAIRTFATLECADLARVDFFVTKSGQVLINEINTLPGFTSISMYPKLWEASGLSYSQLLDQLITMAIERFDHNHHSTLVSPEVIDH